MFDRVKYFPIAPFRATLPISRPSEFPNSVDLKPYYAGGMNALGLQARVGYAVAALLVLGTAGFYLAVWILPKFVSATSVDDDGYGIFRAAIGIALAMGLSGALIGLTLPWRRRRRRSGRGRRIALSFLFVVGLSIGFASQQHSLVLDLLVAAWLAYAFAYTYVRHGILDRPGKHSSEDIRPAAVD